MEFPDPLKNLRAWHKAIRQSPTPTELWTQRLAEAAADEIERLRLVEAICRWQADRFAHTLTCLDSSHPPLFPVVKDGNVILRCAHCNYAQRYIPPIRQPA